MSIPKTEEWTFSLALDQPPGTEVEMQTKDNHMIRLETHKGNAAVKKERFPHDYHVFVGIERYYTGRQEKMRKWIIKEMGDQSESILVDSSRFGVYFGFDDFIKALEFTQNVRNKIDQFYDPIKE